MFVSMHARKVYVSCQQGLVPPSCFQFSVGLYRRFRNHRKQLKVIGNGQYKGKQGTHQAINANISFRNVLCFGLVVAQLQIQVSRDTWGLGEIEQTKLAELQKKHAEQKPTEGASVGLCQYVIVFRFFFHIDKVIHAGQQGMLIHRVYVSTTLVFQNQSSQCISVCTVQCGSSTQ